MIRILTEALIIVKRTVDDLLILMNVHVDVITNTSMLCSNMKHKVCGVLKISKML